MNLAALSPLSSHSHAHRTARGKSAKQHFRQRGGDRHGLYLNAYVVEKIHTLGEDVASLSAQLPALHRRMDELDSRVDRLDARVDKLDAKMDLGFERLNEKLDTLLRQGWYFKGAAWATGLLFMSLGPAVAWLGGKVVDRVSLVPAMAAAAPAAVVAAASAPTQRP